MNHYTCYPVTPRTLAFMVRARRLNIPVWRIARHLDMSDSVIYYHLRKQREASHVAQAH